MACHHWISVCAWAPDALASTAAAATDDRRIRVIAKTSLKTPGDVSSGRKTAMCLFCCGLMTVHQACVENATPQIDLKSASAARITSGASVMMQSTPMPTRALATSPSLMV